MSLAMYAAPFDTDINEINTNNQIEKKRAANNHNRTQKKYQKDGLSEKVNSVLQSIHNLPENDDSDLADFQPIPPPMSAGVEQTRLRDVSGTNMSQEKAMFSSQYSGSQHTLPANITMSDVEMQKKFIPNYENMYKDQKTMNPNNIQYYSNPSQSGFQQYMNSGSNDLLMEKLNYVIHLLEEQQDERTNNVTEEVILYCFLGIFIIFIVDSFSRVGKYTR
jgi:hypothetical protein